MSDLPGQAKKQVLAPGADKYETLLRGGVSRDDADKWMIETTETLKQGGASDKQIAEYWGNAKPKSNNPFSASFLGGLAKNNYNPREATNPIEGFAAGWGYSVAGLSMAKKRPDLAAGPNTGYTTMMAAAIGQQLGDLPLTVAGGVGGFFLGGGAGAGASAPTGGVAAPATVPIGAVIGAGVGSAALPEGTRQALLASYDVRDGHVKTFSDAVATATHGLWETTKAGVVGGLSSFVGGKVTTSIAAPVLGKVAGAVATGTTAVTTGAALNGRVPDARDAGVAATLILVGGAVGMAGRRGPGARPTAGPEAPPAALAGPRPSAPGVDDLVGQAHAYAADMINIAKTARKAADAAPGDQVLARQAMQATEAARVAKANLAAQGAKEAALKQAADEAAARHVEGRVQDAYVQEGITPWEAAELSAKHPEVRQALSTQDVDGDANLYYVRPHGKDEPEPYVPPAAKAPPPGIEMPKKPARAPVASTVEEAEALLLKLEGSGSVAKQRGIDVSQVVSHAGAIGEYQIMPGTALQHMGPNFDVQTLYDPAVNRMVGRRIIADLHHKYRGNMTAIAIAYNAGPGRASKYLGAGPGTRLIAVPDKNVRGGIRYESEPSARDEAFLPLETQKYLANGRRRSGGEMAGDGDGGGRKFPSYDENAVPASLAGAGGGKPPPPEGPGQHRIEDDPWGRASEEDIVSEMMSNIGEDPKGLGLLNPDRLIRQFVSILNPAKRLDDAAVRAGDYDRVKDFGIEDAARQTLASNSRAGVFVRKGVIDSVVTKNIVPDSPSIMSAIQTARDAGGDYAGFSAYRLAVRAEELVGQGKKSGVNPKAAAAGANHPGLIAKYDKANREFTAVKRGALQYALSSGLYNQKRLDAILAGNTSSLHMSRIKHRGGAGAGKGKRAFDPLKKFRGDDGQIADIVLAEIEDIRNTVRAADVNYMTSFLVGDKKKALALGFRVEEADLQALVTGEDAAEMLAKDALNATALAQKAGEVWEKEAFPYFRDGKLEKWYAPDEETAAMIRGAESPGEANVLIETMSLAAKITRTGITAMWDFATMSAVRSEIESAVLNPTHPPPGLTLMNGLFHSVLKTDAYWDAQAKGTFGASQTSMDANWLARDMHAILAQTGVQNALMNVARNPLEAAQLVNDLLDGAARVGVKEHAERKGIAPTKAASLGRTAHLDFAEAGSLAAVNMMSRMIPFLRPFILGSRRDFRSFTERPISTIAAAILGVAVPTVILAYICHEQDKDLPVGQRSSDLDRTITDTHFVFPVIGGVRPMLPMPQGMTGLALGSVLNRGLMAVRDHDPRAFEGFGQAAYRAFVPPTNMALVTPIQEHVTNQSVWSGRPLVPNSVAGNSGYLQFTPYTSELGKKLALGLNEVGVGMSPIVFDNYVKGYAGSAGQEMLRALGRPLGEAVRPDELADNPFVGTFFARHPGLNARSVGDFYDELKGLEVAQKDFSRAVKLAEQGDDSYIGLTAEGAQAARDLASAKEAVSNIMSIVQGIHESKEVDPETGKPMSAHEKRQLIDENIENLVNITEAVVPVIRQLKEARGLTGKAEPAEVELPDFSAKPAPAAPAVPSGEPQSGGAGEVPIS